MGKSKYFNGNDIDYANDGEGFFCLFFLCFFASEFNPTNHLSVQTLISINMFERVR